MNDEKNRIFGNEKILILKEHKEKEKESMISIPENMGSYKPTLMTCDVVMAIDDFNFKNYDQGYQVVLIHNSFLDNVPNYIKETFELDMEEVYYIAKLQHVLVFVESKSDKS